MFLSEINVYPIKSLGGTSLKNSFVEKRGLQFDRRWLLINEKNEFLTQRNFPKMATIKVEIAENYLRVFQQDDSQTISFQPETNETAIVKIWQSRCQAQIYENEINQWFQDVLQTKCKLVLMSAEAKRKVNYFYAVHQDDIVSSLTDLNSKLENPLPMNRFRPNFVVSGSDAFAEDDWKKVKIGDVIFHVVKPCARCVVTTVDQKTGVFDGNEPLKTLANFRIPKRSIKKKVLFGQYLIAENTNETISVGDKIEAIEYQSRKRIFNIKL
jgi:uncharacterized protein YcbX